MPKLSVDIPDDVAAALRLPSDTAEEEMRKELAVTLYARRLLPLGKARQLAGLSRRDFEELLGERKVPRDYTEENLKEDLEYAAEDRGFGKEDIGRPSIRLPDSRNDRYFERFAGVLSGAGSATQALLDDRQRESE
jgi:predicted HTH domain antitoxin